MDQQTTSILSFVALATSIVGTIFGILNGHRIRSNCCGRNASLEIQDITPKKLKEQLIDNDAHFSDKVDLSA